ncbi:MAG TPA: GntR family transcriptional regulator [Acidimicrobiales bacterium]|jgi:DNA-binding transcriptional regulator YhcF (GntR family)|nr:GntR family transcriptional regulator [Acidimicrobiales bacterium]
MRNETTVLDDGTPLFLQIGAQLADDIADGTLAEGDRVPSSNEFAAFYRINPATAAKGINVLIDDGLLEKRRGIGMFVASGARERLLAERRQRFAQQYIEPMLAEAKRLDMDVELLVSLLHDTSKRNGDGDR